VVVESREKEGRWKEEEERNMNGKNGGGDGWKEKEDVKE
jgi:hypothetical protein